MFGTDEWLRAGLCKMSTPGCGYVGDSLTTLGETEHHFYLTNFIYLLLGGSSFFQNLLGLVYFPDIQIKLTNV